MKTGRFQRAFTLLELLLVITIISILAALLLPAVKAAKETAKQMVCLNNMHQIAIACKSYSADNSGEYPLDGWMTGGYTYYFNGLASYLGDGSPGSFGGTPPGKLETCPSDKGPTGFGSYRFNFFVGAGAWGMPGLPGRINETVMDTVQGGLAAVPILVDGLYSQQGFWPTMSSAIQIDQRHKNKSNILFADGHAELKGPGSITLGQAAAGHPWYVTSTSIWY